MAVLLRPVWFGRGPVARAHFIACPHADEILCTWCKRGDDVQVSLRCVIHLVWPQRQAVHVLLARVLVLTKQRFGRLLEGEVRLAALQPGFHPRSEERRVGKEGDSTCSSRWAPYN